MTGFIHPNGVVLPSTVKLTGHQATPPLSALEHPDCVTCVAFSPNNRSLGMTFKEKTLDVSGLMVYLMSGGWGSDEVSDIG